MTPLTECIFCDADAYTNGKGAWECDFGHTFAIGYPTAAGRPPIAAPSGPALDVERLARALTANWTLIRKKKWEAGGTPLEMARAILAAYQQEGV